MAKQTFFTVMSALVALAAAAPRAHADAVILRDGRKIEGTVRIGTDKVDIVTADGKTVSVMKAEVERVETGADATGAKDFRITDDLRRRVDEHRRVQALGAVLLQGGPPAKAAAKELVETGADALPHFAVAMQKDDKALARLAIDSLAAIGVRAAADLIAARLANLDPELQAAALEELARMRAVHTAPAIADLLGQADARPKVRQAAVHALGALRSDLSVPALMTALSRAETSRAAADALVALASPAAVAYLDRVIQRDDETVRSAAAVLSKTAMPEHAGLLLRLKKSSNATVSTAAASALSRLEEGKADRLATYVALVNSGNKREADSAAAQLRKLTKYDPRDDKAWMPWWVKQNQARARIAVVPIGDVDPSFVSVVERAVERGCEVKVLTAAAVPLSPWARIPGSQRYRDDAVLDHLEPMLVQNPQVIAAIGVTAAPLESAGSGAVMGAFRLGRSSVISLPGLEAGADARRLKERLAVCSLHALARALRIRTAESATCPAVAVYEAAELDRLNQSFSEKTAAAIAASSLVSISALAGDLDSAIRELEKLEPVADAAQWSIELATLAERKLDLKQAQKYWTKARDAPANAPVKSLIDARITLIQTLTKAK